MATKTLYLNSTGVTPTNIHASTSAYTTPAIAKNGGTYRIAIKIDLWKALGVTRLTVNNIKLHYTVYGTRTGVFGSKGTVDTGYSYYGSDTYQTHHGTAIGRGSSNATPFSDDVVLPDAGVVGEATIIMRYTNPIATQTNSFVISNLSIVIDYTPRYEVVVEASPSGCGEVTFKNDNGDASLYPLQNSKVTFTATPYSGYRFVKWQDGNTDNPRTITITSDVHFIGYFELDKINNIYVNTVQPKAIYHNADTIVFVVDGTIPSLSGSIWDTVDGFSVKVQNTVPSGMTEVKEVYVDLKKYYG